MDENSKKYNIYICRPDFVACLSLEKMKQPASHPDRERKYTHTHTNSAWKNKDRGEYTSARAMKVVSLIYPGFT